MAQPLSERLAGSQPIIAVNLCAAHWRPRPLEHPRCAGPARKTLLVARCTPRPPRMILQLISCAKRRQGVSQASRAWNPPAAAHLLPAVNLCRPSCLACTANRSSRVPKPLGRSEGPAHTVG